MISSPQITKSPRNRETENRRSFPFSVVEMENFPSDSDLKNLVRELSQGKELAKQLQNHLNLQPSSSSSLENRDVLLRRIMYSYDQALSMLGGGGGGGEEAALPPPPLPTSETPWLAAGSPQSDDSDQDLTDQASKKRKSKGIRWSEKVKVRAEAGIEGQLDDGYGWRKYGQKDILGAKHPRGYYRCTYRHAHGCLATKQVQRSDEDPTVFEITYRRKHTCNLARATDTLPVPVPDPHSGDPNSTTRDPLNDPPLTIQTSPIAPNSGTNANPFDFPSSLSTINPLNSDIFSNSNDFLRNYYPISTDDPNNNYGDLIPNLHHSGSELSPIVAAMTSTTNSANVDPDFPFGPSGFGSGFGFGGSGNYP